MDVNVDCCSVVAGEYKAIKKGGSLDELDDFYWLYSSQLNDKACIKYE